MQSYGMLRARLSPRAQTALDQIREFCLSLDDCVVEDIRAHRVVYGKTIAFRWFADVKPEESQIIVRIQRDWRQEPLIITTPYGGDVGPVQEQIRAAYDNMR